VVEDILVVRTFRFMTQNNTPEGDGLFKNHIELKSDIKYSFIDRLSLLFNVEDEVSLNLYYEAGFEDLFRLKDYKLIIDAMQEANYKEFLSYIKLGEEAELRAASVNPEDLTLQDYSLGKLLSLLILNTIGLIVAQVMKIFYSLANKFKSLSKQNVNLNRELEKQKILDLSNAKLIMHNEIDVVRDKNKYEEQVS